ncbi:MAG: erythronate-4-phosphate dehydrogenase, partial [Bacteroidales bacterium]
LDVDTSLITPPAPKHPIIDATHIDGDLLTGIILKTYPVEEESETLKAASADFVKQRDHYPLRRDFCGYTVINASADLELIIRKLGFN